MTKDTFKIEFSYTALNHNSGKKEKNSLWCEIIAENKQVAKNDLLKIISTRSECEAWEDIEITSIECLTPKEQ